MSYFTEIKEFIKYWINSFKTYSKKERDSEYKKYFLKSIHKNIKTKIELENVTKVYENGIMAIDSLSLKIEPGEFVVLLGPSGCGKTTLLRMIAGLESISDGYAKFNSTIINGVSPKDREIAMVFQNYALYPFMTVSKNISFGIKNKTFKNSVYREHKEKIKLSKNSNYQDIISLKAEKKLLKKVDSALIDSRNRVKRLLKKAKISNDKKNIDNYSRDLNKINKQIQEFTRNKNSKVKIEKINNEIKNLSKNKNPQNSAEITKLIKEKYKIAKAWYQYIPEKISEITKMLGINMYVKRKPADLSGGQRQRVALARAISKDSGLFLYDEPLSNLDAKLRAKMRTEIRKIHENLNSTSIYVTHDQLEAMSMADKIVVMNKGYIQQIGTPLELLEKPYNLFVAKFIGNTDINIIDCKYDKDMKFKTKNCGEIYLTKRKIGNAIKIPKEVSLAFRPEHAIVDPQIVSHFPENKFTGEIIHKELLGNDVLLTLKTKELGELKILSTVAYSQKIGDKIKFIINPNKVHIYDKKTGFNIIEKFNAQNENAKQVWINNINERKRNIYLMNKEKNKMSIVPLLRLKLISLFSKNAKQKIKDRKQKIDYGDQLKAS